MDEALRAVTDEAEHGEDFLKQNFETLADVCSSGSQTNLFYSSRLFTENLKAAGGTVLQTVLNRCPAALTSSTCAVIYVSSLFCWTRCRPQLDRVGSPGSVCLPASWPEETIAGSYNHKPPTLDERTMYKVLFSLWHMILSYCVMCLRAGPCLHLPECLERNREVSPRSPRCQKSGR